MLRRRFEREYKLPYFIRKVSKKIDPLNILIRNKRSKHENEKMMDII
jgi:hypothetical protein